MFTIIKAEIIPCDCTYKDKSENREVVVCLPIPCFAGRSIIQLHCVSRGGSTWLPIKHAREVGTFISFKCILIDFIIMINRISIVQVLIIGADFIKIKISLLAHFCCSLSSISPLILLSDMIWY